MPKWLAITLAIFVVLILGGLAIWWLIRGEDEEDDD